MTGHADYVYSVAISPDGKTLAPASGDKTVKLWNLSSAKEMLTLVGHTGAVWNVGFANSGKTIVSSSFDATVRVWETATGKETRRFKDHASKMVVTQDGKSVVTTGGSERMINFWDIGPGTLRRSLKGNLWGEGAFALSADGAMVASGEAGEFKVWNLPAGKELVSLAAPYVNSLAFSPSGKILAVGDTDASVRLWDVATWKQLRILKCANGHVNALAFTATGDVLASGGLYNRVELWDVAKGSRLALLEGHKSTVDSVAFSPDGKTLASGSLDGSIKVWDVSSISRKDN